MLTYIHKEYFIQDIRTSLAIAERPRCRVG